MSREALGAAAPDDLDVSTGADDARYGDGRYDDARYDDAADLGLATAATPDDRTTPDDRPDPDDPTDPDDRTDAARTHGRLRGLLGPPGAGRGRFTLVTLVAVAVTALVVGALGGSTSASQQAQARVDAATRVVLAVEAEPEVLYDGEVQPTGDVLIMVNIALAGRGGDRGTVRVERLRTPLGTFAIFPPVVTTDGAKPVRSLLRAPLDCTRVRTLMRGQSADGRLLADAVAQVRADGTTRDVDVPVLLANPDTVISPIETRCREMTDEMLFDGPTYDIGALTALADASVTFVVSPGTAFDGGGQPQFSLATLSDGTDRPGGLGQLRPVRADADTATFELPGTNWTITSSPRLPLIARTPTFVRLRVSYLCPRRFRPSEVPTLPDFPTVVTGTVDGLTEVRFTSGWDDAALQSAAAAAVVRSCPRAGSP